MRILRFKKTPLKSEWKTRTLAMGVHTEKMKMKEKKQSEGIFDDIFALNLHIKYLY